MRAKLIFSALALIASLGVANAQQGLWPNLPIYGSGTYCASTTNGVCTSTIPAGPSVLTGNEQFPANTELPNGTRPQNALVTPASLNAGPIQFVTVLTTAPATNVSASAVQGGVYYRYDTAASITQVNITLPTTPIDGQQFVISSNRTITTLAITAASGQQMGSNSAPSALTASLTLPQGYKLIYNLAANSWYKLQ